MADSPQLDAQWKYPLLSISEDKRAARTAVPYGGASELIGVDGNAEEGVGPFPGFICVHQLSPTVLTAGIVPKSSYTARSVLLDVFPIAYRVSSTSYGFGFVYRIKQEPLYSIETGHTTANDGDVFFDQVYAGGLAASTTGAIVVKECSSVEPMGVATSNLLNYVTVRGRAPALFYFNRDTPYALVKLGDTAAGPFPGPGLQCKLLSPEEGQTLGTVTTVTSGRPGHGQIWIGQTTPSSTGLALVQADTDPIAVQAGDYSFAYQLYNSKTGRKSSLSDIAYVRAENWVSVGTGGFMVLELRYDSAKFDQCYVYRSVRIQNAGGTYIAGYLHLEKIITLADYHTNVSDIALFKHAIYYYQLEDKELVFQDYFQDQTLFDEVMPKGGSCIMLGTTFIISNVGGGSPSSTEEHRVDDGVRGLGETRWSSSTDISPELFPPGNSFVPKVPTNDCIAFVELSGMAVGWSADRMYFIRKDGQYLRVQEIHEGFGIVGKKAVDVVSGMAYFLTTKGLKSVDANGALDDVKVFNRVVLHEWSASELSSVSIAYDALLGALFIHNPTRKHTLVLWFNTGKATELYDTPFTQVVRGVWPTSLSDLSSTLVERAFFVQDAPDHDTSDGFLPDWKPRICLVDTTGRKTGTLGQTLVDTDGLQGTHTNIRSIFTTTGTGASQAITLTLSGGVLPRNPEGAFVYVLSSPTASWVGQKAQVYYKASSTSLVFTDTTFNGLPAGSVVGISPVYLRWTGHPVGTQDARTGEFSGSDFHRIKNVESLVPAMTDCEGSALSSVNAFYRGLVYRGSDITALAVGQPSTSAALSTPVTTIYDREGRNAAYFLDTSVNQAVPMGVVGNCLTPALEIFCPNVGYKILSVLVKGKILSTSRSRNSL